jgi:hypothetical protein
VGMVFRNQERLVNEKSGGRGGGGIYFVFEPNWEAWKSSNAKLSLHVVVECSRKSILIVWKGTLFQVLTPFRVLNAICFFQHQGWLTFLIACVFLFFFYDIAPLVPHNCCRLSGSAKQLSSKFVPFRVSCWLALMGR